MKALSLTQPYATLVALGAKRIETRGWGTTYRGPLAIHAARSVARVGGEAGFQQLCRQQPFARALATAGSPTEAGPRLPRGAIVATAVLVDCLRISPFWPSLETAWFWELRAPAEEAFDLFSPGRYLWFLDQVQPLPTPLPARGALGLWEWVPEEALRW